MAFNKKFFSTGGIVASSPAAAAFDPLQNFETVTYTGNGGTQKITGYIRKGAAFNGSSSYIQTSSAHQTTFSLSAWLYADSISEVNWYGSRKDSSNLITIGMDASGKIKVFNKVSNTWSGFTTTSAHITANTWHHVVVNFTSSDTKIYVDGSDISNDHNNHTTSEVYGDSYIGATNTTTIGSHWNGKIDQVRIFDKALSSSEVTTLYGETYASSTKSTTDIFGDGSGVALYELDEDANDTGGIAIDSGQSGDFDGSSNIGLGSAFTGSTITFSVWFKTTNTGSNNTFFSNGGGQTSTGRGIFFHLNSSGYLRIVTSQGGASQNAVGSTNVADGNWHNAVMSYNSGTVNIYLDGNTTPEVTSTSLNYTGSANCDFTIGSFISTSSTYGDYFDGQMDDIRIYNTALTSTQAGYIANNDTSNIPTSQGYYKLDGNANDSAGSTNGSWSGTEAYSNPAELLAYNGTPTNVNFLGMAFQPDLVWIKDRDAAENHVIYDSIRGATYQLNSNNTSVSTLKTDGLTSFNSNGFSLGSHNTVNTNSEDYVAWCWKAGGTAVSNTDGSITSTVSANQDAGFSIVKYTGNNSTATVGHGLSSAPEIVIIKRINSTDNWQVSISNITGTTGERVYLNLTQGTSIDTGRETAKPSATVLNVGGYDCFNEDYIAYCFHSVDGYQKVGSYTGTGASGNNVTTGFTPRFLMIKNADDTGDWAIFDSQRSPSNPVNDRLMANLSSAESTNSTTRVIDFDATSFELKTSNQDINASGDTYIYLAIA